MEIRKEEPSDPAIGTLAGIPVFRARAGAESAAPPVHALESPPAGKTLADLAPGEVGRVLRVGGDAVLADRLRELGFCAGTRIRLERRAPLGDPLVFVLRGTRLALRQREARRIEIESPGGERRNG